jgi:hypothetical protein
VAEKLAQDLAALGFYPKEFAQFQEFLSMARLIGEEITSRRFYKRPGKWCGWCDYLAVCTGDEARAKETVIQKETVVQQVEKVVTATAAPATGYKGKFVVLSCGPVEREADMIKEIEGAHPGLQIDWRNLTSEKYTDGKAVFAEHGLD